MRLIDADKLTELCDIMSDKCCGDGEDVWNQFRTVVEWSPRVDAVPVIRCIECKHSDVYNHCTRLSIWNKPEDFCSYGERIEE